MSPPQKKSLSLVLSFSLSISFSSLIYKKKAGVPGELQTYCIGVIVLCFSTFFSGKDGCFSFSFLPFRDFFPGDNSYAKTSQINDFET